jgi:trimeric autotransporter adhesin
LPSCCYSSHASPCSLQSSTRQAAAAAAHATSVDATLDIKRRLEAAATAAHLELELATPFCKHTDTHNQPPTSPIKSAALDKEQAAAAATAERAAQRARQAHELHHLAELKATARAQARSQSIGDRRAAQTERQKALASTAKVHAAAVLAAAQAAQAAAAAEAAEADKRAQWREEAAVHTRAQAIAAKQAADAEVSCKHMVNSAKHHLYRQCYVVMSSISVMCLAALLVHKLLTRYSTNNACTCSRLASSQKLIIALQMARIAQLKQQTAAAATNTAKTALREQRAAAAAILAQQQAEAAAVEAAKQQTAKREAFSKAAATAALRVERGEFRYRAGKLLFREGLDNSKSSAASINSSKKQQQQQQQADG